MRKIGSQIRELLRESGFKLVKKVAGGRRAILQDKDDGHLELWVKNDHYAGYVIVINGTGYEYLRRFEYELPKPKPRRRK